MSIVVAFTLKIEPSACGSILISVVYESSLFPCYGHEALLQTTNNPQSKEEKKKKLNLLFNQLVLIT